MKNSHLGVEKPGYDELAGLERKVLSRFPFEEEMGSQGQRPRSTKNPSLLPQFVLLRSSA